MTETLKKSILAVIAKIEITWVWIIRSELFKTLWFLLSEIEKFLFSNPGEASCVQKKKRI